MLMDLFQSCRKQRLQLMMQRALASLLLSLCFLDLTVVDWYMPELCEADSFRALAVTDQTQPIADLSLPPASDDHESSDCDEDCFCCCAHILPSAHFSFPALAVLPERVADRMSLPLSALPTYLYRPPRLA